MKPLEVKSGRMKSYHANSGAALAGLVASEHPITEPGTHPSPCEFAQINSNIFYNAVATVLVVLAGNRAQFIAMNRAIAINQTKPIIDHVFPFDDVVDAFRYYEKGLCRGFSQFVQDRSNVL